MCAEHVGSAVDVISLRRAAVNEVAALSDLAFRSKASWGYDEAFMAQARPALTITAQYVTTQPVYVLLRDGCRIGFFGFIEERGGIVLDNFGSTRRPLELDLGV